MSTDLQHAITWLREQDQDGALELCLRAGLDYSQANELLAKTKTPAFVAALAPVPRLSSVQETALLRAVEAVGWRAPVPETGPLLELSVRYTATDFELKHHPDAIKQSMARALVEQLLEGGYLRLETFRSDSEFGKFNLQLGFRPGPDGRGFPVGLVGKRKGPNDAI